METLIDFNSAEGEAMRQEQRKKGQILNGTYREDKDVELRHLLFSGDKAKARARARAKVIPRAEARPRAKVRAEGTVRVSQPPPWTPRAGGGRTR